MAISFVQSQHTLSANTTSPIASISKDYILPNTAGNIGFAFVFNTVGVGATGISDTNENSWCAVNNLQTNVGLVDLFCCLNLAAGANTVTVTGTMSGNGTGGPGLILGEISAPAGSLVCAMQPNSSITSQTVTGYGDIIESPAYTVEQFSVMFIYDMEQFSHLWSSLSPSQIALDSVTLESNGNTACMAYQQTGQPAGSNLVRAFSSIAVPGYNILTVLGATITALT